MPRRRVDTAVAAPFRTVVSRRWLRRVVLRTLDVAFPGQGCRVDVAVTGDDAVRELNRRYRGLDETTDVLAFAPDSSGPWEGAGSPPPGIGAGEPFVLPPGEMQMLGEVMVSYPQAERQAPTAGHSVERELALLVVHGVLHLLGYDHADDGGEKEMRELEERVLRLVFLEGCP